MKSIPIVVLFATVAFSAEAACLPADALIQKYGISFSGFKKQIPQVAAPLLSGARTDQLVVIRLPNSKGSVPDGFIHSAVINKESKQAWINRKGGFVYVNEWFGPVPLTTVDFNGCVSEQYNGTSHRPVVGGAPDKNEKNAISH